MNRPALITAGIVIVLSMVGIWVYLLAYGAPKQSTEIFTNLGFFQPKEESVRTFDPEAQLDENTVSLALEGSELQQLTTRSVAGFAFTPEGTRVRYVEQGTGYIFEIDLSAGTEKQLSPITIAQASEAVFSPDTQSVAITAYTENQKISSVFTTENNGEDTPVRALPPHAENIAFKNNRLMYYSVSDGVNTTGFSYDLQTLARTQLFSIPINDVLTHWGETIDGIFVQTKPSSVLEGYLYEVRGNALYPTYEGEYGLSIFMNRTHTVVSHVEGESYRSYVASGSERLKQGLTMLSEKCTFDYISTAHLWCTAPLEPLTPTYFENWHKGSLTSEDHIWSVDLQKSEAIYVGDLPLLSGRTIDVADITINIQGERLLFTNKLDGALWLFRITQEE